MGDRVPSPGNGDRPTGSAVKHSYTVTLLESGQIIVGDFPVDPMLATFMHTWAWEIMRDWFKQQQTSRLVLPIPRV